MPIRSFLCEMSLFGEADFAITIAHAQNLGINVKAKRVHHGWWTRIWRVTVDGTSAERLTLSRMIQRLT